MLHPSYTDLMKVVNSEVEEGETPVVNSRYSIVLATAKRARQIIDGAEPMVDDPNNKPLSMAVEELNNGKIRILAEDEIPEQAEEAAEAVEEAVEEAEAEAEVEAEEATEDIETIEE